MLFLFVLLCIQQIQAKNCTVAAWYFIAGLLNLCYIIILQNLDKEGFLQYHTSALCFVQNIHLWFGELLCQRI